MKDRSTLLASDEAHLSTLQTLLLEMRPSDFEHMLAKLLEHMLDLRFTVARAGSQEGGDAGTVGGQGRRLRIEAKRYSGKFDARDLIGGFRQALARDPSLECWIAASTRDIPEQLANALEHEGNKEGVPVLAICWDDLTHPTLAALCSAAPDIVSEWAGEQAALFASELASEMETVRGRLARELQAWSIGFERVRRLSHQHVQAMWTSKRAAKAQFGQDIAGGDGRTIVQREKPLQALNSWWSGRAETDAPAAVTGPGGVGKTWIALHWVMSRLDDLPIIITLPAGAITPSFVATSDEILRLIGLQLTELTGVCDALFWAARMRKLLTRPPEEGPAFCLVLDGINQNPSVPWVKILQRLQDQPFSGRVRTILTTRPQDYDGSLGKTRALAERAEEIKVEKFDDAAGGEFDKMLAANDLVRADLHPDLIEFARVPRLFGLAIHLRERLDDAGRVTVHRLLWEYGRDVQGERAGKSFSETDWRAWLATIAARERKGLRVYSMAALGETTARPDLDSSQIAARLSDIIDGNLAVASSTDQFIISPEIVAHALGMALLDQLDNAARDQAPSVEAALAEWFDPIDGLEERAEILRAATSIMAERDAQPSPEVAAAVVAGWLQTQNLPETHLAEIRRLAPWQVPPLLEAVERSRGNAQAAARALAVDAIRDIPFEPVAYGLIVASAVRWFSRVSRDLPWHKDMEGQPEIARSKRYMGRIGVDVAGPHVVLGFPIELIDYPDDDLLSAVATLLDGKPLAGATEVFARAALTMTIRGKQSAWDDLKWLCLLNEVDPDENAVRLRALAKDINQRAPEAGIHSGLGGRVAALMLWLSGIETDEELAVDVDSGIERVGWPDYASYLADPAGSRLQLERRHAAGVLANHEMTVRHRIQRCEEFLIDPSFEIPFAFIDDVRTVGEAIDVSLLNTGRYNTQQDHDFEQLEISLARCAPDLLADLQRRKLAGYATRPTITFDASAWCAVDGILVADESARKGCRSLRERSVSAGGGANKSSASSLLLVEIAELPAIEQIERALDADLDFISVDFVPVLKPLSEREVDELIDRHGSADSARIRNLVALLSAPEIASLSEPALAWLIGYAMDAERDGRGCAFDLLVNCEPIRFGRHLLEMNWSWASEPDEICKHAGSVAIAEAGRERSFEEIAPLMTPGLLPMAARERGSPDADVRLAARIVHEAVTRSALQPPDPGATLSVKTEMRRRYPLAISITPEPITDSESGPLAAFSISDEERLEHSQRAVDKALSQVRDARAAGASLYLTSIEPKDLAPIVSAAPELVSHWLEGAREETKEFVRRVRLAEGFFLALCETLLSTQPEWGALLWRALSKAMGTSFRGRAGVDERILMLFRVPNSPAVAELRTDILSLKYTHTDKDLMDVSIATIETGHGSWFDQVVEADRISNLAWRRRRAIALESFGTGATLPLSSINLEGEDYSPFEERRARTNLRLARDAAARHWWRLFASAENPNEAFAAWTLFRRTADRRALAWLESEGLPEGQPGSLASRKRMLLEFNDQDLAREADNKERNGSSHLFGRRISDHVRPWYRPHIETLARG